MHKNYLCDYVKFLLDKNKIAVKDDKTSMYLTDCIENIIFNVVSIAAIITHINNCKMVRKESITIVSKYLTNMCGGKVSSKMMKGGDGAIVMPSEFYGIDSNRYSTANAMTEVLKVDFNNSIARPQIGGGMKKATGKPIEEAIKKILDYYKLKASADITKKILKLIEKYIKCLMSQLTMIKGKVSTNVIKKMMKSSKFFDIFK